MKARRRIAAAALVGVVALLSSCVDTGHASGGVRVVTVHAVRYEFKPSEVTIQKGQPVKFVFISDDVPHGIVVDDLGIDVDMPKNQQREAVITPSATGDFEGECSRYCGTGHSAMTFTVHVR